MSFPNVILIDHPVIQTKLTELRDYTTDHRKFRALLDEIAGLMVYEVTRDWPTKPKPVQTPLEQTTGHVLARNVTLVPILRAGLGMADGVLKLLPDARLGHLGVYRDEKSLEPVPYYQNVPMLGRLLAEWDDRPAGALFLLPLWHPVLLAEHIGTLASIAAGPFIMQCALGGGAEQFDALGVPIRRRPSSAADGNSSPRVLCSPSGSWPSP